MGKKTKAELIAMNDSLNQELETQRNTFADFKKQQEEEMAKLKMLLQQATNGIASTSAETLEQKQAREIKMVEHAEGKLKEKTGKRPADSHLDAILSGKNFQIRKIYQYPYWYLAHHYLTAELQVRMSRSCRFLLFLPHK